jgi:hypothetical protein
MPVLNKLLIQQLVKKKTQDLAWADFMAMLGGLSAGKRIVLLGALKAGNVGQVGKFLVDMTQTGIKQAAEDQITAALADGKLTATEIENIFGAN